jgi:hypothetical protein
MVKKYFLSIATAMILTLSFTSCDKWIDPALNDNPDAAKEVPHSLLLPAIQLDMAYVLGSQDVVGITSMWVQYAFGSARQAAIIGAYNITESDINNLWNSIYDGGMMDTYVLLDQAADAPEYTGVAKILMAVYLGNATDLFGDIPYTEAFLGLENLTPAYDSQESIYTVVQSLLSGGIADLNAATNSVENDFIYGGDAAAWIKAAYSLKARYAIHLSSRNAGYATEALGYIANGFASNADDLTFWFGAGSTSNSPIFQFADDRGDMTNANYFFDLLATDNDPREVVFEANSTNTADDYAGLYYGKNDGPVELMTYTELMFIAAEAALANSDETAARTYLKAGVTSSINKYLGIDAGYDADAPAWLAAKEAELDAMTTLDMETIMMQKYIARYLSPESYNDYRRTGYPMITPSGTQANVPTRFPYPTNERLYNSSTPSLTKNDMVWWDNN